MITQEVYDEMKLKYGKVGSWGIWTPQGDTPITNLADMSIFDEPDLLETLHTNFVFLGINESGHDKSLDVEAEDWNNFHSGYSRTKDYNIRAGFTDTVLWGSYMTDMIKNHYDPDSGVVLANKELANNPKNVEDFKDELEILGGNPILVSFGGKVNTWLKKHFSDTHEIMNIRHYSYRAFGPDKYKIECEKFINDNNLNERFK